MSFKMKYEITRKLISKGTDRRPGIPLNNNITRFLTAHDSGNPGATAMNHYDWYMNTLYGDKSSAQIFVDDKYIIELIPAFNNPEKAYQVWRKRRKDNELYGYDAIDVSIGTELCYGGKINNYEAYKRYVWVHAYLCYLYGLNIRKHIIGHYRLDPKRRIDPINALKLIGKSYDNFINDVAKEYEECTEVDIKMKDWERNLGEAAIKQLAKEGLLNKPEQWIEKLEGSTPKWLFFHMIKELNEKIKILK